MLKQTDQSDLRRDFQRLKSAYLLHLDGIEFSYSLFSLLRHAQALNAYDFVRDALQQVAQLMEEPAHRTLHGFFFDIFCSEAEFKNLWPYLPSEIREEYEWDGCIQRSGTAE